MSDRDPSGLKAAVPGSPGSGRPATKAVETTSRPAALNAGLQAHIGRHLRNLYEDIVEEPVPDRFVRLLDELERQRGDRG